MKKKVKANKTSLIKALVNAGMYKEAQELLAEDNPGSVLEDAVDAAASSVADNLSDDDNKEDYKATKERVLPIIRQALEAVKDQLK